MTNPPEDMVERVGAAIEDAMASDDNAPADLARAAIAAMRQPTEAMLDAACSHAPDTNSGEFSYDDALGVFQRAIDRALEPSP